jgi:hypothetical protein
VCNGNVLALLEHWIYRTIIILQLTGMTNRPQLSLRSRLGWCWAGLLKRIALRAVCLRMCTSLWPKATLRCANSPTVLTNPEPCRNEAVRTFSPPMWQCRAFIATEMYIHALL